MGGHYRPVSVREVEAVLKYLGYMKRPRKSGSSHDNWTVGEGDYFRKVTVDANNAPFKDQALAWMLGQMKISKKDFYRILDSL